MTHKDGKRTSNTGHKLKYFLGEDEDGTRLWLEAASWDCDWYWGFGYVQGYLNGRHQSHQHFDGVWFKQSDGRKYYHRLSDLPGFTSVLTESEEWTLAELMRTFYTLKEMAEVHHLGSSHFTTNPIAHLLKDADRAEHINKVLMPALFAEVYKLLTPKAV